MGKDMELLLLKKDVEEKLNALNALKFRDLPKTVTKVVDFVSGCVDFGSIDDQDRPTPAKTRARPGGGQKAAGDEEEKGGAKSYTDSWVQTDRQATMMAADRGTMTEDSGGSIASVFHSLRGTTAVVSTPLSAHAPPPPPPPAGDDSADDDITLAARRRRRRERGQVGPPGGCWAAGGTAPTATAPHQQRHQSASATDRAPTGGTGGGSKSVADADDGGSAATRRN